MAAIALALGVLLTALNTLVAGRTLWKDWKQRKEKPHPLDAPLREIAAALRAHVSERDRQTTQLREAITATDEARRRWQWKGR